MMMMMMMTTTTLVKLVNSGTKIPPGIDKFYQSNSGLRSSKTEDKAIYPSIYVYVYIYIPWGPFVLEICTPPPVRITYQPSDQNSRNRQLSKHFFLFRPLFGNRLDFGKAWSWDAAILAFYFPVMIFILWWCAPILWVHIQCIPMYPNVLFVRSEQVLCVLLAVLFLEACATRALICTARCGTVIQVLANSETHKTLQPSTSHDRLKLGWV